MPEAALLHPPDPARRLAAVRAVHGGRGDARSTGDVAYVVYATVLVLAIVVAPLVRGLVIGLSGPEVLGVLTAPSAARGVGVVVGLLLAACVLLGQVRGPALTSPFFTVAVAGTDLPRSVTLRRPFCTATALLVTSSALVAAVLAWVLHDATGLPSSSAGALVLGASAVGLLAAVAWLLGQRLSPARASGLAGILAVVTGLHAVVPTIGILVPTGWAGALWPVESSIPSWAETAALPALVAAALLAVAAVPRLLDALGGVELLAQARRWETAGTSASAGDLSGALGQFRPPPRTGRAWWAVRGRSSVGRFVVRDLVGALRTPARAAGGALVLVLAGTLLATGLEGPELLGPVVAAVGAVVGYLALGVVADGFRHAAEAASAPTLYRYGTGSLFALHGLLPTACALLLTGAGTAVVAGPDLAIGSAVAALACFLVLVRARDSAKGPLPPQLLTPVSTPAGDASGVAIVVWQADALIVSALVAAAASTAPDTPARLLVVALGGLGAVLSARARLRRT
ncbi:hypothetical protein [Sanguibacter sp. 25GB23B1]|uniref:hypothetical protein n=1 Tax=unclassified Sanguibacter TaxID=2645534 RepID=UPI0032AF43EF